MANLIDKAVASLLRRRFGASYRDEFEQKRQRGLIFLAQERASWYMSFGNVHTVVRWLLSQEIDCDAMRRIVSEVMEKPWRWRPEFVVARCMELDQREPI